MSLKDMKSRTVQSSSEMTDLVNKYVCRSVLRQLISRDDPLLAGIIIRLLACWSLGSAISGMVIVVFSTSGQFERNFSVAVY